MAHAFVAAGLNNAVQEPSLPCPANNVAVKIQRHIHSVFQAQSFDGCCNCRENVMLLTLTVICLLFYLLVLHCAG